VPDTIDELRDLVKGSVPFALMFAMVCYIWWEHNKFFRRYGLQDAWTAFLNCVLLFLVLFYVYPLKFLTLNLVGGKQVRSDAGGWQFVMLVYSTGAALVFAMFVLLYLYAWRRRTALELDASELLTLRFNLQAHLISTGLAIASIGLALVVSEEMMWLPGVWYGLMGPLHGINGYMAGRAQEKLKLAGSAG
jgi:hypothetical protein